MRLLRTRGGGGGSPNSDDGALATTARTISCSLSRHSALSSCMPDASAAITVTARQRGWCRRRRATLLFPATRPLSCPPHGACVCAHGCAGAPILTIAAAMTEMGLAKHTAGRQPAWRRPAFHAASQSRFLFSASMDFNIPASLLRELPAEPADLLAVSARLAQYAWALKASSSDAECSQLRALLLQRQTELRTVGRRAEELEAELAHLKAELRRAYGEVDRLNTEKATLVDTVKSLSKEVAKLDHFKRNLMKTLNEEEPGMVAVDALLSSPGHAVGAAMHAPYGSPRLADAAPYSVSAATAAAPTGKDFFRSARARLSPEAYARLLQSIKDLNAHLVRAPEVLEEAQSLFIQAGAMDLYSQFEALLQAHLG